MKKLLLPLLLLFTLIVTGCASKETDAKKEEKIIKVGVRSAELKTWDFIKEQAAEEGLKIEVVNYSSAYNPDESLVAGDIDANAFQHIAYLDQFNEMTGEDLVPIGTTIIAPLGLYSNKYKKVEDFPEGSQIAVPNDASNWGRALLLLQEAGLITVVDGFDGNGGEDKVKDNPKKIKIVPTDSASTPRVMDDVAGSVINNGIAVGAGLGLKDAVIHESKTAKPYINIIAVRKEDQNNKALKKLVEIYQSKETAQFIEKTFKGNYIPTILSLEELGSYKEAYNN
ncbi:MetQ/NlpA family ABC transporter substrate-binding protein [Bacillus massiliigorillae]|uniref:MetQ/NlpA family ABC transporter substrate-binding protein n=1 Tax=Bacillus massiliigorillae TaxID=1243664 RepID=UPI0003A02C5D|nr:MetQ/NlpA family ABC transporter substrate-binding protein [Bacillus massiliigorillae]